MNQEERRRSEEASYFTQDLSTKARGSRRTTITNAKFSVLVVCPCGEPTLRDGEVEQAVSEGVCEDCGRALPHFSVLVRAHAAQLAPLRPTVASQVRAGRKTPELAEVLTLPGVNPDAPPERLTAIGSDRLADTLVAYLQTHGEAVEEILRRAQAERDGQEADCASGPTQADDRPRPAAGKLTLPDPILELLFDGSRRDAEGPATGRC